MAIVKLGAGITDISGKFSGMVFARDKTGLHLRVNPTKKKDNPTMKQRYQRSWYAGIKREESKGGPPPPEKTEPMDPSTYFIYALHRATFQRVGSFSEPQIQQTELVFDPLDPKWIAIAALLPELQWLSPPFRELAINYYIKSLERNLYTWGLVPTQAAADAVLSTIAFISKIRTLTAIIVAEASLLYSLGWFAVAAVFAPMELQPRYHNFARANSLIYINRQLYWAQLYQRYSKYMFDFQIGTPLPFPRLYQSINHDPLYPFTFQLGWESTVEIVERSFPYWFVYSYENLEISTRAVGWLMPDGLVRVKGTEDDIRYYGRAIGWTNPDINMTWTLNIYH